ncbi:MAG: CDP-alcohol phosphatidyltransferase family protein [Desulfobacteraceae bacterium]
MVEEAVILLSEKKSEPLPSYLFAPVAGLPLLQREIFGLWRAGIASIIIMVSPPVQPDLEEKLSQLIEVNGNIKIISDWETLWEQTLNSANDNPRLVLLANILPDPRFLTKLVNHPVPVGTLGLGLVESASLAGGKGPEPDGRFSYPVVLEDGLVTSLGSSNSDDGLQAAGLVLFSPTAWQGWHQWQQGQGTAQDSLPSDRATTLFRYVAHQARENRVLGVVSDPNYISAIHYDQDGKEATARLIAAADGSPLGNGRLETSLNRALARKLLPRVLTSSVTPNQITVANLWLGLAAALGFAVGSYEASLAASLLLPLVMVLDCLDGTLARLKFQESKLGAKLDLYGDTVLNLAIFWGIAVGQYRASDRPLFLELGLLLTLGYLVCWWLIEPSGMWHWNPVHSPPGARLCPSKLKKASKILEEAVSRDFFYIILLAALFNLLDYLFIGIAVGTNIFALFLFTQRQRGQA